MEDYNIVKNDFDAIAELDDPKWNHNGMYFPHILNLVPADCGTVLDIGCGKGKLSYLLSHKCEKVVAVDLSDKMIAKAKALHSNPNISYICGNILDMRFEPNSLSAIVTTATAHHLPYEWLLQFAKESLKKGGILAVLDLAKPGTLTDRIVWSFAAIPNVFLNLVKNGSARGHDAHEKELWQAHSQHDSFMTLNEIRQLAEAHIPSATVKRKLFWRYLLVWEK